MQRPDRLALLGLADDRDIPDIKNLSLNGIDPPLPAGTVWQQTGAQQQQAGTVHIGPAQAASVGSRPGDSLGHAGSPLGPRTDTDEGLVNLPGEGEPRTGQWRDGLPSGARLSPEGWRESQTEGHAAAVPMGPPRAVSEAALEGAAAQAAVLKGATPALLQAMAGPQAKRSVAAVTAEQEDAQAAQREAAALPDASRVGAGSEGTQDEELGLRGRVPSQQQPDTADTEQGRLSSLWQPVPADRQQRQQQAEEAGRPAALPAPAVAQGQDTADAAWQQPADLMQQADGVQRPSSSLRASVALRALRQPRPMSAALRQVLQEQQMHQGLSDGDLQQLQELLAAQEAAEHEQGSAGLTVLDPHLEGSAQQLARFAAAPMGDRQAGAAETQAQGTGCCCQIAWQQQPFAAGWSDVFASDAAPKQRLALALSSGCTRLVHQFCRNCKELTCALDSGWTCTHAEPGQQSRSSSRPDPSLLSSAGLPAQQSGGVLGSLKQPRPMSAALKQVIAEQLKQMQTGEPGAGPQGPAGAQPDLSRQQSQLEGDLQQRHLSGGLQQGAAEPPVLQKAGAGLLAGPQQGAGQALVLQGPGAGVQLAAAPLAGAQRAGQAAVLQMPEAGLQPAAAPLAGPRQGAGQPAVLQGPGARLQRAASPLAGAHQGAGQAETARQSGVAPQLAAFVHVGRPRAAAGPQSEPRGLESLQKQRPASAVNQQAVLLRSQDRQAAEQTGQAQKAQTGSGPHSLPTRPGQQPAGPQQAADAQLAQLQGFATGLQSRAAGLGAPQAGWHSRPAQTGSEPQSLPTTPEQQPAGPQQAAAAQQAADAQLAQLQGLAAAGLQSGAVGLGAPQAGWHPRRQLGHLRQPRPMSAALQQVIRQQSTLLHEQEAPQEAAAYGVDAPAQGQHAALESLAQAPHHQASAADGRFSLSGAGLQQSREQEATNTGTQLQHPQRSASRLAVAGQSASGTGTPEQPPARGSGLQSSPRTGSLGAAAGQAGATRLLPQQRRMKASAAAQKLSAAEAGAADRAAAVASRLHPLQQQNRPMSAGMKTLLQQQRSLLAEQVSTFFKPTQMRAPGVGST